LYNQFDRGYEPSNTEAQRTFTDQTTGQRGRVDYYYDNGQVKLIDEVKGGYVSGQYHIDQAGKYNSIAGQQGATLRYFLCGGASLSFQGFLAGNQIWFTLDCEGY